MPLSSIFTSGRLIVAGVIGSLLLALWLTIESNASVRADLATKTTELEQANQAIFHLSDTIKEERELRDETDRMLADTARDRRWIEQEADALAQQLADVKAGGNCLNSRVPDSAALRLFRFRDRAGGPAGTSPENMDGSATAARPRPTYGEYIAAAEQFFQECNADRSAVRDWSSAAE